MVSTKHCLMTVKLASVEGLYHLTLMFSENPRAQFKKRLAMFFEAFVVFEETAASSFVLIKLLNVFIWAGQEVFRTKQILFQENWS